jgi:arabinofuranosyltransferase
VARATFAIASLLAAALVLSRAWVADDAFITWRVIENLLAGHGLRWNADERVQVFTHPLWALLHVPLAAATGSLPVASLALSAACLLGAGALAWRAVRPGRAAFLLAFAAPLALSRAFADHAVSGLESPLLALCLAGFAALALRAREAPAWLGLSLAAALLATTRLDALLLVLPALCLLAARRPHEVAWGRLAAGALPLVAWELWSLFYYGFALPNTKYAKLDTGIAAAALARQGLWYALDLVRRDAAGAGLLALALACSARRLPAAVASLRGRGEPEALAFVGLGAGVAAYAAYVVAIGGDFMSGRFFAPAVFIAAVLVAAALRDAPGAAAGVAALALAASLASASARPADPSLTWHGIADERRVYERTTSLLRRPGFRDGAPQRHPWYQDGARARALSRERGAPVAIVRGAVGMLGFAAGPGVIVIDSFGLGDPLLARLPAANPQRWRIGHFQRSVPAGYVHARESGDASRMQPDLARYHEALRRVVAGPLLDPQRLREIVRFHTGGWDEARERYLRSAGPSASR